MKKTWRVLLADVAKFIDGGTVIVNCDVVQVSNGSLCFYDVAQGPSGGELHLVRAYGVGQWFRVVEDL